MVQYASTTDSLTIDGVYWVDTVVTGLILDGRSNSITATLKDVDSDTVTTFDGDFTITAQDDNGLIVQVSADGSTYTDSIDVSATSGAYTGSVYFETPDAVATPIAVRFQVASADAINEYQPYGVDSVELAVKTLMVSAPSVITRGASFNITIGLLLDGILDTSYTPAGDIDLSIVSTDVADILNPPTTDNTGWSGGLKTVACTVSGGADSDGIILTAEDSALGASGTAGFSANVSTANVSSSLDKKLYRYFSASSPVDTNAEWSSTWSSASVAAVQIDDSSTLVGVTERSVTHFVQSTQNGSAGIYRLLLEWDTSALSSVVGASIEWNYFFNQILNADEAPDDIPAKGVIYDVYIGTWTAGSPTTADWNSYSTLLGTLTSAGINAGATGITLPPEAIITSGTTKLMILQRGDTSYGAPALYGSLPVSNYQGMYLQNYVILDATLKVYT